MNANSREVIRFEWRKKTKNQNDLFAPKTQFAINSIYRRVPALAFKLNTKEISIVKPKHTWQLITMIDTELFAFHNQWPTWPLATIAHRRQLPNEKMKSNKEIFKNRIKTSATINHLSGAKTEEDSTKNCLHLNNNARWDWIRYGKWIHRLGANAYARTLTSTTINNKLNQEAKRERKKTAGLRERHQNIHYAV